MGGVWRVIWEYMLTIANILSRELGISINKYKKNNKNIQ